MRWVRGSKPAGGEGVPCGGGEGSAGFSFSVLVHVDDIGGARTARGGGEGSAGFFLGPGSCRWHRFFFCGSFCSVFTPLRRFTSGFLRIRFGLLRRTKIMGRNNPYLNIKVEIMKPSKTYFED
jgi:hypothetical protein